jgi:hypothetical protein
MSDSVDSGSKGWFVVEPDPAWDWSEDVDGVLTVELSWKPDGIAGRLDELVTSPALLRDLQEAGFSGFNTGPARGYYREDSFGADESTPAPDLIQLNVDHDEAGDIHYVPEVGLIVSGRVLSVLKDHCTRMSAEDLDHR